MSTPDVLIAKIKALPKDRLAEIEDFIDFLAQRVRDIAAANQAARASVQSFAAVWDNVEDSAYDAI